MKSVDLTFSCAQFLSTQANTVADGNSLRVFDPLPKIRHDMIATPKTHFCTKTRHVTYRSSKSVIFAEIQRFFIFKMAAIRHLGYVGHILG